MIKRIIAALCFLLMQFIFFSIPGNAQTVSAVSTTIPAKEESCVTSNCHGTMGKGVSVHNPVKEGTCSVCHQITQESEPGKKTKHPGNITITLVQPGANLCYKCHAPKNTRKIVHAPISGVNGDCTVCHNPHQAPNIGLLKEPVPALCFRCHQDSMMKNKVMHSPVEAGKCSGCHFNHQGDLPNRLVMEGNALCYTCHQKTQEGVNTKKDVHSPVKQSCVLCHDPHGSANKVLLSNPVPAICSTCHPNEVTLSEKSLNKHSPMTDEKACMNCHEPHYSDQAKLLPMPQKDLCISCHNKELTTEMGTIKDLKAFLSANNGGQGPLKDKPCFTCHNPHGSDYWRLLVKFYSSNFYTSYSDSKYAMCFTCHEKAAFTTLRTQKATKFRDGERNLHFIHVNKLAKGRTCRACHDACAVCQSSGQPNNIKETVGFSYWSLPMNFTPSKNGGSCAPGCHGEKMYTR